MPDITAQRLPLLQSHRLPGLDLPGDFIYPHYHGNSILNIPPTVCSWLGVPALGADPLSGEIIDGLGGDIRRVILVLMDALGLRLLQRWMSDGSAPVWQALAERGVLAPLTSIAPSTTSAALTALWTGRPALSHGILGYEMWLKEYGIVANTINHAPISFKGDAGSLSRAGFDPEKFVAYPMLGAHLGGFGVKTYAFQQAAIAHSGLSTMLFKDTALQVFHTPADLWINLRRLLEKRPAERLYAWAYWGEVDHFGHLYGPHDERTAAEFSLFSAAFERYFLNALSDRARQDTLLILTADHGQLATEQDAHYELRNHPGLTRRLHMAPSGENRMAHLFLRPGQTEAVREYVERAWPNQFALLEPAYAVESGLLGEGEQHPRLYDRLGDLLAAARGGAYWWWADKDNFLKGRHGGLHADEMLVPFLAFRL